MGILLFSLVGLVSRRLQQRDFLITFDLHRFTSQSRVAGGLDDSLTGHVTTGITYGRGLWVIVDRGSLLI